MGQAQAHTEGRAKTAVTVTPLTRAQAEHPAEPQGSLHRTPSPLPLSLTHHPAPLRCPPSLQYETSPQRHVEWILGQQLNFEEVTRSSGARLGGLALPLVRDACCAESTSLGPFQQPSGRIWLLHTPWHSGVLFGVMWGPAAASRLHNMPATDSRVVLLLSVRDWVGAAGCQAFPSPSPCEHEAHCRAHHTPTAWQQRWLLSWCHAQMRLASSSTRRRRHTQ